MKKKPKDYFNVVTGKDGATAEIYLYGYIGQDFWWDDELKEESITDLAFIRTLRELESKHARINIRINSPGGSMYHGNAIVNAIRASTAEIHTYNDGLAASMGGLIWMAGHQRHMSGASLLMIHAPMSFGMGNARELRKEADVLDAFAMTAINVAAEACGKSEDEIFTKFFDYEDHWLSAAQAQKEGMITAVENYKVQAPPADPQNMKPIALMEHYRDAISQVPVSNEGGGLGELLSGFITSLQNLITPAAQQPQDINPPEMTFEDFQQSLADGTLDVVAVTAHLQSLTTPAAPAPEPVAADPVPAPTATAAPAATEQPDPLQAITEQLSILAARVEDLAKAPAAAPSNGPAPTDTAMSEELKAYNAEQERLAQMGQSGLVRFGD